MNDLRVDDLVVYQDARGRLAELVRDEAGRARAARHVFMTTAYPGQVKGNHYHLRKTEWFIVVRGRARIALRDRSTGAECALLLDEGRLQRVWVPPSMAHAIRNEGDGEMIALVGVDEVFQPADADTFAEVLLSPIDPRPGAAQ